MLVKRQASHQPVLADQHGEPLDLDSDLTAGTFTYEELGEFDFGKSYQ
jgi:hypothetical protein